MRIAILPIGSVDVSALEGVRLGLSEAFPYTDAIVLEDTLSLPDEAYNRRRGQHHSSRILLYIEAHHMKVDVDRILGVTEADLYVPRLNFVFGEAMGRGGSAIISLFRLRPEFYGSPPDRDLFLVRASKEAIHEIGHTLSLGHCSDRRCVMFFSNSIRDTDRKGRDFCQRCYKRVLRKTRK